MRRWAPASRRSALASSFGFRIQELYGGVPKIKGICWGGGTYDNKDYSILEGVPYLRKLPYRILGGVQGLRGLGFEG